MYLSESKANVGRLGSSTDTLVSPSQEALDFAAAFDYSILASATRARLGWAAYIIPEKKFDNAIATCKKFIDRYVEKSMGRDKMTERPYVFLDEILKTGASRELVRDQLLARGRACATGERRADAGTEPRQPGCSQGGRMW